MIYVRSKMSPPLKSGPIWVIEGNCLYHVITVGDPIVNKLIFLEIHQKPQKYHDISTQSDVDHRLINIFR